MTTHRYVARVVEQGRWVVDRVPSTAYACKLRYEVTVKPKLSALIPSEVVAAIMRSGLPINLRAVGARAEELAADKAAAPKFAQLETLKVMGRFAAFNRAFFPSVGSKNSGKWGANRISTDLASSSSSADAAAAAAADAASPSRAAQVGYLGGGAVVVPPPEAAEEAAAAAAAAAAALVVGSLGGRGVAGFLGGGEARTSQRTGQEDGSEEGSERTVLPRETVPAFGLGVEEDTVPEAVEVHLRRLDDDTFVHRRVVAMVRGSVSVRILSLAPPISGYIADHTREAARV